MVNNKASGVDGLPAEVSKKYGEVLLPELLKTLNSAVESGNLPMSMSEAIIIVLPNSGKDSTLADSYRSISKFNRLISIFTTDIKLLAKILGNRLSPLMRALMHMDQSEFISLRSTAINIRKLFLNL